MISGTHAEIVSKTGSFYIRDTGSDNHTYIDGKKLKPLEEFPLKNGAIINMAGVLELECNFYGELKRGGKKNTLPDSCFTVLGERSDTCFGVDKKGAVDAIRFRRLNNYSEEEEYLIVIREATIGRSPTNGIVLESDKVSDFHAKVVYRDGQYWVEDLNSKHGTWVNDKEAAFGEEILLGRKAKIVIGDVTFSFESFA